MSVIRVLLGGGQAFFCPGCHRVHAVNSSPPGGPRWTYNGDPVKPTFTPSILARTGWSQSEPGWKDDICHSFVTDGRIRFLEDCTHALAGLTVDLPDWPHAPGAYGGIVDPHRGSVDPGEDREKTGRKPT